MAVLFLVLRLMSFIYSFLIETCKTIMYLYINYLLFKSPTSAIYVGIILLLFLTWLFEYIDSHPNGIYVLDAKKHRQLRYSLSPQMSTESRGAVLRIHQIRSSKVMISLAVKRENTAILNVLVRVNGLVGRVDPATFMIQLL